MGNSFTARSATLFRHLLESLPLLELSLLPRSVSGKFNDHFAKYSEL